MTHTTFQAGSILYAANLNSAFANAVNTAGDTMTGSLILPAFYTTGGVSYANGGINTSSTINTVNLNVAGLNIYSTLSSAFSSGNTTAILAQAAFDRANSGGAAGGIQTIITANGITVNTRTSISVTGNNTVILSANLGNTTQIGVVQLNDTVTSTSSGLAATANAVNTAWSTAQAAFNRANSGATGITQTYITANGITVNTGTLLVTSGNGVVIISANLGNTTQPGIVQLNDTVTSTALNQSITANVANTIWTTARAAFNKANAGGGAISQNFITANGMTVNTGTFLNTSGNNSLIFSINAASITQVGVVQLDDTVISTSTTAAATANAVSSTFNTAQAAFNAANAGFSSLQTTYLGIQGVTINNAVSFTTIGSATVALSANSGTTNQPGILQLNDSVNSGFSNQAATANVANTIWSTAQAAFNKANLNGPGITTVFLTSNGLTVNNGTSLIASGNTTLILAANNGTNTQKGVVQLNDTVTSTSTSLVATANAVNTVWATANAAFKAANNFSGGITTTYFATNGLTVNNGTSLVVVGSGNPIFSIQNATTIQVGAVQLNDTLNSTLTTQAATIRSVNAVSTVANNSVQKTGDTMSGALVINNNLSAQQLTVTGNTYLNNATLSSNGTVTLGNQANTRGTLGRLVYAAGKIANTGDTQLATNMLYRQSTSNTPVTLTADGQNVRATPYGSINFITLPNNSVYVFKGYVAGRDTSANLTKVWSLEGAIKRGLGAATVVFVPGSPIIDVIADDDPLTSNWFLNFNLDTTNGGMQIVTTGTSNTINWTSKIETIELA